MATRPKFIISSELAKDIDNVFRGTAAICKVLEISDYLWDNATNGVGIRRDDCMNAVKDFFRVINQDDAVLDKMKDTLFPNVAIDIKQKYAEKYAIHDYDGFVLKVPKS